ncbi:hypothetical protein NHQ30_008936 [Ciborinia camelliae]|nr:hypothetical protein NHQ30_008936 [Ciborinia camelliae]
MAAWLIFCISQVSSETLEAFQTQSTRSTYAPSDPWVVQKSPLEEIHGPELSNPPPSFTTGFKDASPTDLQTFMKEKAEGQREFPDLDCSLAKNEFVVLDERSARDDTCLVYHRMSSMPEGSAEDEWDEESLVHEWKVWRVKFLVAWHLCVSLDNGDDVVFSIWEEEKAAYVDRDGIFQLAYLEQDRDMFPDLENRVSWGPVN